MARIYLPETGETVGDLTQDQLQFLIDQLEEEHAGDQDYDINPGTLELLKDEGCDPELLRMLAESLGEQDTITIAWD